jgi:GT2 family glycosyltransferase
LAIQLVNKYIKSGVGVPQLSYLKNQKKILAAGWNIGIKAAKGKYIIRIDAHATADRTFIRLNVETIMKVDAVCVGGKLITKANTETGEMIKDVLSSSFGVGNSSFRVSNKASYTDTVVYGLYDKRIFDKVGYFDENLSRNQDIELHSRIKRAGGKFYFEPKIESTYYSRDSVKKMIEQAYGNGFWNVIIFKKNNAKLSLRHMVPFCAVFNCNHNCWLSLEACLVS